MDYIDLLINLVWCAIFFLAIMGFPIGLIYGKRQALKEIYYCDCDCHLNNDAPPRLEDTPEVVRAAQSRLDSYDVLNAEVIE